MTQKKNTQKLQISQKNLQIRVFLQNCKKPEMEIYAFCGITFEPNKIQTHLAPKNDRLNLSFLKNIYVVGQKMT